MIVSARPTSLPLRSLRASHTEPAPNTAALYATIRPIWLALNRSASALGSQPSHHQSSVTGPDRRIRGSGNVTTTPSQSRPCPRSDTERAARFGGTTVKTAGALPGPTLRSPHILTALESTAVVYVRSTSRSAKGSVNALGSAGSMPALLVARRALFGVGKAITDGRGPGYRRASNGVEVTRHHR
jgi:hypothetical protein